jgi:hypothetical protein
MKVKVICSILAILCEVVCMGLAVLMVMLAWNNILVPFAGFLAISYFDALPLYLVTSWVCRGTITLGFWEKDDD